MMLSFHLKTVIKSLRKSGKATVFNTIGLSVSFAAFMLLSVYLYNEFTFDRFNTNYKNIYRLNLEMESDGEKQTAVGLPNPMADVIFDKVAELDELCSFAWGPNSFAKETNKELSFNIDTEAVDSTFKDIFTIKIKSGSQHPLKGKNGIIISEKTAKRVFGNEDPVGKILLANFKEPYVIESVFYDVPVNSSFKYDAYCSYPHTEWINNWSEYSFIHYFKIVPNSDFDLINDKILEIQEIKNIVNDYPEAKVSFSFTPLKDLHFDENGGNGNLMFSRILVLVAVLLLFMAYVNYLNFAVANTPKQIKMFTLRSIAGESKASLYFSGIIQNILLISMSYLVALAICLLTIKLWPNIFGYDLKLSDNSGLIISCFFLFVFLGAVASIYPSKLIIGKNLALALKGIIPFSAKNGNSGNVLTLIQYAISIFLITGMLFIEKQVSFLKNFNLGFDKENVLVINTTSNIKEQENSFANELLKNPNITDYAYSQFVPGGVGMGWGRKIEGKQVSFKCWPVDENYINFMGFDIVEGRNFSDNIEGDENNFIFNQKALEEFEWRKGYLGKEIPGFDFKGKLVGIVKDMKYASLHEDVQPMAFWLTKTRHYKLSLKIKGDNVGNTINYIKTVYSQFENKFPIKFTFLDETLDSQYKTEEKQAELIFLFCMISIIISVVGALGLIIFISEYRIKEIGIRKVNGAKVSQIVFMLNKSFIKWVLIAFVISTPFSYLAITKWLEGFAYKTETNWWIFVIAGAVALVIALIAVSWHCWRSARKNPVEALRYE